MVKKLKSLKYIDFSELTFPMIVIYDKPEDYPEYFMARVWDVRNGKAEPTDTIIIGENLELIREDIVAAGFRLMLIRAEGDDPHIVETWI